MEEIILLVDYKKSFGSKFNSNPPYSGLDLDLFLFEMKKNDFNIVITHFHDIDFINHSIYSSKKVLYQSSEANDSGGEYKSYIDDVLYYLKLSGAILIPDYKFFKSHSNKVFMEMIRSFFNIINTPKTFVYGSLEDFEINKNEYKYPLIVKKSHGAQSKGVYKVENKKELYKLIKSITFSKFNFSESVKEFVRSFKYKNYIKFSSNRNKFIVQPMIEDLSGDFKVLVFGNIIYVIKRDNPPNDFRASGGGINTFNGDFDVPSGLLEFSYEIFEKFNCPYVSLDIGFNSLGFHLIEFQFVNFGTSGHVKSKKYFLKEKNEFILVDNDLTLEYLYAFSLNMFFKKK